MKIFKDCLIVGTSLLFVVSCQDMIDPNNQQYAAGLNNAVTLDATSSKKQNVTVIDGRLVFANNEAFTQVIKELQTTHQYTQWETQFADYTSSRTAFSQWEQADENKAAVSTGLIKLIAKKVKSSRGSDDYQRIIPDDLLATLVNKEGLLQIGDTVCLVTESEVRKTVTKSIGQLSSVASSQVIASPNVNLPISYSTDKSANGRLAAPLDQDEYDETFYTYDGDLYRFYSNWWAIRYNFPSSYTSTGINIKHQRDGTFSWRTSNAFNWRCTYTWLIYRNYDNALVLENYMITAPTANDVASYQPFRVEFSPSPPQYHIMANGTWIATGRNGQNYSRYFTLDTITG